MDIKSFLDQDQDKDLLRLLTCGSVDDGKSTLIGRLLFDSKKLYEDQLDALERDSKRMGNAGDDIDYALLLDGLKAEREQGITIDVAYRYFSTSKRKFIIADTPGHEQYTRNMVTGGSTANLAILLVDARKGIITQTKRHSFLVNLLGIKHVVLAVNKMDLVDYSEQVYDKIRKDYRAFVALLDIPDIRFIPISALKGDNVVELSDRMPWYHGKPMLEFLEDIQVSTDRNFDDFRFPVQYVIRPDLNYRGFSGKVASGLIRRGDEVISLPSGQKSRIKSLDTYDGTLEYAFPPQSVVLTLEDEIDVSRGDIIVKPDNQPKIERHFEAMLVWMDEKPMDPFHHFYIKHNTHTTRAKIDQIRYKIDVNTLDKIKVDHFELNDIGRAVITSIKPIYMDAYKKNRQTGSFVLIDSVTNNTSAVGMILDRVSTDHLPSRITDDQRRMILNGQSLVSAKNRELRLGQKPATIWITGLHGSGKNDLAYALEKALFDMGKTTILLDGSTIRSGLSKELDFSPTDRAEHLRRVAHIARILNDQGLIVICSFISPDQYIRDQIAKIIGPERFKLVFIDADLEYCRNKKTELYKQAEQGLISHLPGYNETYEKPVDCDLVLNPNTPKKLEKLLQMISKHKIITIS